MLKFISILNIFIGICFFFLLKSDHNYIDMILISAPILFNFITFSHFLKNNSPFKNWHIMIGAVGVAYAVFSIYIMVAILSNEGFTNFSFLRGLLLAFDILIASQFILAIRKNSSLKNTIN